jgi:hypothetical protein
MSAFQKGDLVRVTPWIDDTKYAIIKETLSRYLYEVVLLGQSKHTSTTYHINALVPFDNPLT